MAKTALQFHGRIYPVGHSIPKLKEWFAEPGTNLTATVFHVGITILLCACAKQK